MKQFLTLTILAVALCSRAATFQNPYTTNAPGVSFNAITSTNVGSVVGSPQNMNLPSLTHVSTNISAATTPLRVVTISDQSVPVITSQFERWLGYGGNMGFGDGKGGAEGGALETGSSGVIAQTDTHSWPFASTISLVTNGESLTYSRFTLGSGSTLSNRFCDSFMLHYLADPMGGNFKVQTNNGNGWVDCRTITSFASGVTNQLTTNITFGAAYLSARVLGITAAITNRILGGGLYYSASNNFITAGMIINGESINDVLIAPTNLWWAALSAMNPNLILMLDTDGIRTTPYWSNFVWMTWSNICPVADIVIVNNRITSPAGTAEGYNAQLKTNAAYWGFSVVDVYTAFGTNLVALTNQLLVSADNVHYTTAGAEKANNYIWTTAIQPMFDGLGSGAIADSRFKGTASLFNFNDDTTKAVTNRTGVGTVAPDARFTVMDGYGGSADAVSIGSAGNQAPFIEIGTLGATHANKFLLNFVSSQFALMSIPTSAFFQFKINNSTEVYRVWPSGAVAFGGAGAVDPGLGNAYFDNAISVNIGTNRLGSIILSNTMAAVGAIINGLPPGGTMDFSSNGVRYGVAKGPSGTLTTNKIFP